jgi:hypothetical protein
MECSGMRLGVPSVIVAAQVIVPVAASMASDGQCGRVVGTVITGLLVGILVAPPCRASTLYRKVRALGIDDKRFGV